MNPEASELFQGPHWFNQRLLEAAFLDSQALRKLPLILLVGLINAL